VGVSRGCTDLGPLTRGSCVPTHRTGAPFTSSNNIGHAVPHRNYMRDRQKQQGDFRAIVDEITPVRAKTKAAALLDLYAGRGANRARVLNAKNEVIFRL
jgi:hypothetical protein